MCGIGGFITYSGFCREQRGQAEEWASNIRQVLRHRGPDGDGTYLDDTCCLVHTRLSIIDPRLGAQPMLRTAGRKTYALVYNGEIYNTAELRERLSAKGYEWQTTSDTEVLLCGLIEYGEDFIDSLNGIFAFAFWDGETLLLVRDRLGVKPLFYCVEDGMLRFGSEPKALFACGLVPQADTQSFRELFALGPARLPGSGVFKGVRELLPGQSLRFMPCGVHTRVYWKLESQTHIDGEAYTAEKTAYLVRDAIERQMVSDVGICTFLSGGLDSSLVSAVCARKLQAQGRQLTTFSFDFDGNDEFYKANAFQPGRDAPFAAEMAAYLGTDHHVLWCDNRVLADLLDEAMTARDLPGMADVDASLLYFCRIVGQSHKVALTGECADEIFGGYPWFRSPEAFAAEIFPWTRDLEARKTLLKDEVLQELEIDNYALQAYRDSVAQTPRLPSDTAQERRRREIAWLNLRWFMQCLLERMDRTSMSSCLEARVPFADHRIVEYVWNVPWAIKCKGGVEKNLLREAGRGLLPDSVLWRKKSPYPKTYNPLYENILKARLREVICDPAQPVNRFIDKAKAEAFLGAPADYGKPWYGQLMAAPQRIAYFLQVNAWLKKYGV